MNIPNTVQLAFGRGSVPLRIRGNVADLEVIRPASEPPVPDAEAGFHLACRRPFASHSLRDVVHAGDRVLLVTSDGTRPVPNRELIRWLLAELPVPPGNVSVLLGNGTHRKNTRAEIEAMFGTTLPQEIEIVNHNAFDPDENECAGSSANGERVYLNKRYLEADKRILLGFIEPHFFAGFSGGAKGIVPGIAGVETIFQAHRAELIADPRSTWGRLADNPVRCAIADMVALCPPDFMINVTLNTEKEITGFYAGNYIEAHAAGCRSVKSTSMVSVPERFGIVVTSNSGFPLDQNLYQSVKGISAAGRIVKNGGIIILAAECGDGIPASSEFARLIQSDTSPRKVLSSILAREQVVCDQWQAQVLAGIMAEADIAVYSRINRKDIEACNLAAVDDLQSFFDSQVAERRGEAKVAVLPDGPLTIPYLADE